MKYILSLLILFTSAGAAFAATDREYGCEYFRNDIKECYPNITNKSDLSQLGQLEWQVCIGQSLSDDDMMHLFTKRVERDAFTKTADKTAEENLTNWYKEKYPTASVPKVIEICETFFTEEQGQSADDARQQCENWEAPAPVDSLPAPVIKRVQSNTVLHQPSMSTEPPACPAGFSRVQKDLGLHSRSALVSVCEQTKKGPSSNGSERCTGVTSNCN